MKIVTIFAPRLYAFHYAGERVDALKKMVNNLRSAKYINDFIKQHEQDIPKKETKESLRNKILDDVEEILSRLEELSTNPKAKLDEYFKPLNNETYIIQPVSKQKGRENYLRIYAIRIEENLFVITGAAIKLTLKMQDRDHTYEELKQLDRCQHFIRENGVVDEDSFHEFLIEHENQ